MQKESLARWLKSLLWALIVGLWINCITILCIACWIRDNVNPLVLAADGTSVGNFYIHSFFPVLFPVLITASCLLLVIGCVGCCGSCTQNKVLLGWFFMSMLVTFCVEVSSGVWGKMDWSIQTSEEDIESMYDKMNEQERKNNAWINKAWEKIHEKFNCCGIRSPEDWIPSIKTSNGCNDREFNGVKPCGQIFLNFLTKTQVMRMIPFLATVLGILQIACLIVTGKLWMLECVKDQPKSLEGSRHTKAANSNGVQPGSTSCVASTSASIQTMREASRKVSLQSSNELLLPKLRGKRDYNRNTNCPQCLMKWYEETQLMTSSRLEAEYNQFCREMHFSTLRPLGNSHRSEEIIGARRGTGSEEMIRDPTNGRHHLTKSSSYHSSANWKSSSLSSVRRGSRSCHSASLPRRKQPYVRTMGRHKYPMNYVQRLSTIRASGVAVESDSSSEFDNSHNEVLGGSKCYNTEAGSSPSSEEVPCAQVKRERYISEPCDVSGCIDVMNHRLSTDYTTL